MPALSTGESKDNVPGLTELTLQWVNVYIYKKNKKISDFVKRSVIKETNGVTRRCREAC